MARSKKTSIRRPSTPMLIWIGITIAVIAALVLAWYQRKCVLEKFTVPTEPNAEFPIILFEGENYTSTRTALRANQLSGHRGSVKSLKILPGKKLNITHTCGGQTTTTSVSRGIIENTPQLNLCGWVGVYKTLNAQWQLVDDIIATDSFPVVLYSESDYGGVATPISPTSAPTINQVVKSFKIKSGYELTLSNHKCIPVTGGCTNSAFIWSESYVSNTPRFSPCNEAMRCFGITVMPNTLSIVTYSPWRRLLKPFMGFINDWQIFYSNNLKLSGSLRTFNNATTKGIYVGYYKTGGARMVPLVLDGTEPPSKTTDKQGHYSDTIMNTIQFTKWRVFVDRIGDGDAGRIYEVDASSTTRSVMAILAMASSRGVQNAVETHNGVVHIAGNREVHVWVDN